MGCDNDCKLKQGFQLVNSIDKHAKYVENISKDNNTFFEFNDRCILSNDTLVIWMNNKIVYYDKFRKQAGIKIDKTEEYFTFWFWIYRKSNSALYIWSKDSPIFLSKGSNRFKVTLHYKESSVSEFEIDPLDNWKHKF